ncbi:MAG TPA: hypothetical protein PLH02_03465 [Bacillota bacterium]|nr:hypothetical protein [Bacillota bacterium]HPF42781.1 hypothetical protein [Bacillota bacterium]HPJ85469.1 hypothetical protein [Bacillota bacterium]HPQ61909.1 hypothetical protein [Bacillota bacterium]HRX91693.1 hypothetical protein [Candidatus Izemoplasmatales bacterium]
MKKFSLTTLFQKLASLLIDAFFIAFYLILFIEGDSFSVILLVFGILTLILCITYTAIILHAKVIVDRARDVVICRIVKSTIYDIRHITNAKIEERLDGHKKKNVIALYNELGYQIGEINPYLLKKTLPSLPKICDEINGAVASLQKIM